MDNETLFEFDRRYLPIRVAGCDEAGRGSLAGPVVCAVCFMPLDKRIAGIDDSKKLSAKMRETLYGHIQENALDYRIAAIDVDAIDSLNILGATKLGMSQAIHALSVSPDLVLIDAVRGLSIPYPYESWIGGDAKSYNIAAASILAKVYRDRLMVGLDAIYPEFCFGQNKGYGTKRHIKALQSHGPTPLHRKLFIRNALSQQLMFALEGEEIQ